MELAPLVPLRPTSDFMLAGAKLAEILGRFGHRVGKQVHFDPAQWFTYFARGGLVLVEGLETAGKEMVGQ